MLACPRLFILVYLRRGLTAAQEGQNPFLPDLLLNPFSVPLLLGEERITTLRPGPSKFVALRKDDGPAEQLNLEGGTAEVVHLVLDASGHGDTAWILDPLDVFFGKTVTGARLPVCIDWPLLAESRAVLPVAAGEHTLEEEKEVVGEAEGGAHKMVDPVLEQLLPFVGAHVGLGHAGGNSSDFHENLRNIRVSLDAGTRAWEKGFTYVRLNVDLKFRLRNKLIQSDRLGSDFREDHLSVDPTALDIANLLKLDSRRHKPQDIEEVVDSIGGLAKPAVVAATVLESMGFALLIPPRDDVLEDLLQDLATTLGLENRVSNVGALVDEASLDVVGVEVDPGVAFEALHGPDDLVVEDRIVTEGDAREPRGKIRVDEGIEPVHGFIKSLSIEPLAREGDQRFPILELNAGRDGPEARAVPLGVKMEPLAREQVPKVNFVGTVFRLCERQKLCGYLESLGPPVVPFNGFGHSDVFDIVQHLQKVKSWVEEEVKFSFEIVKLGTR